MAVEDVGLTATLLHTDRLSQGGHSDWRRTRVPRRVVVCSSSAPQQVITAGRRLMWECGVGICCFTCKPTDQDAGTS